LDNKSQVQKNGGSTFNFVDTRSEAITQRKLQEIANNSPRVSQLKAFQDMADKSPQVNHIARLRATADNYSAQRQQPPIQKKENNTGLPDNLKTGMENLSGMSMDDVEVHHNSDKPAQLQAHAYAQGTDIHLAPGQEKHLPHEAWHVVQQKQGRVKPTMQMKGKVNVNDDSDLEREADVMGIKALSTVQEESTAQSYYPKVNNSSEPAQLVIQRAALDVAIILDNVPAVLANNSLLPKKGELNLETILYENKTLKGRIEEIVSTYEAQFQKTESPMAVNHNAQKVLTAFHTIGMVIARKLHMGQEGHKIAKALLISQKDRLISELKINTSKTQESNALSDSDAKEALKMAEVLVGDDPVGMYIQDKTSLKKADTSIRVMATELNKTPIQVFELLRHQFESRIGSLSKKDVVDGEKDDEKTEFPLKDLYGEVSENFFKNLLDLDDQGKAKWTEAGIEKNANSQTWTGKKRTFQLNDVEDLRKSVNLSGDQENVFTIDAQQQQDKGWERLNNPQMEYLTDVEADGLKHENAAKERIIKYFTDKGLERSVAIEKMNAGVGNLSSWPITLTTKAQDMVKADNTVVDTYKPFFSIFQREEPINQYLPALQTDSTVKIVEDVLGRGLDYGQERKEKDEQQIGFDSPINVTDMPAMACINYAYIENKGSNYYGDTHFVLSPEVRKRSVFTYSTDCPERRSFFLVLDDMLAAGKGASMEQICAGGYALQDIEVHTYGNIDLRRDIIEFHLGNPNELEDADTRSSKGGMGTNQIPGKNPIAKLKWIKTNMSDSFEDLKTIWIKKQKGTEKLKELIKTLPEGVQSNINELGETKQIEKSGPCYITTACIRARGLADDCEELQTLRYFRDKYISQLPSGLDLVMFYYEQAPKIVEAINQDSESGTIYEKLYLVIRDCVKAIHEKRSQEAFTTYVNMVLNLRDQYIPDMDVPESLMRMNYELNQAATSVGE
jgi:hypothetical protein